MEKLYEDGFMRLFWDKSNALFEVIWFESTNRANDEDYIHWNSELVKRAIKYRPKVLLANAKEFYFTINPQMQEWAVKNIFEPYASIGLHKIALVISEDFISQVSIEQFIEEYEGGKITNKYFDDLEKGRAWLLE